MKKKGRIKDLKRLKVKEICLKKWGERGDSNPRPLGPQPSALTT